LLKGAQHQNLEPRTQTLSPLGPVFPVEMEQMELLLPGATN